MTYEIETQKGFDGWRAESVAVLGETPEGTRKLELTTSKARGGIAAHVTVSIYKDCDSGFSSKTTEIFGDFRKSNIAPTPCKRVTEKAILEVHEKALLQMGDLIAEATEFYRTKNREAA